MSGTDLWCYALPFSYPALPLDADPGMLLRHCAVHVRHWPCPCTCPALTSGDCQVEGDLRAERERGEEASLSDLDTSGILGEEEEDGEGVSTPTQSPKKGDGLELATPPSLRSKAPMMKTRQSPDTSLMDETLCFDLGPALLQYLRPRDARL